MSVSLRECIAVTRPRSRTRFIGFENSQVGVGMVRLQPRQKRWTEVETNVSVVIDSVFADERGRVCGVAFGMNAFVPIVVRRGAYFALDSTCPGIFAWRLIKMAMNY